MEKSTFFNGNSFAFGTRTQTYFIDTTNNIWFIIVWPSLAVSHSFLAWNWRILLGASFYKKSFFFFFCKYSYLSHPHIIFFCTAEDMQSLAVILQFCCLSSAVIHYNSKGRPAVWRSFSLVFHFCPHRKQWNVLQRSDTIAMFLFLEVKPVSLPDVLTWTFAHTLEVGACIISDFWMTQNWE